MLVAITGATGFIGSLLVRRLAERGDRVRALVRSGSDVSSIPEGVEIVRGDLFDSAAMRRCFAGADVLFHLAAVVSWARAARAEQERVNVEGTRSVMDAARASGVSRVVFTSSVAAIGIPARLPADETNPFSGWEFDYFRTKYLAERAAFLSGLEVVAVNPGTVFGGGASKRKTGSQKIIGMVARGIPFHPTGSYCACDADDVVAGHLAAAERGRAGERYILGGHNFALKDVFGEIARQLGVRAPWIPVPGPLLRVAGFVNEVVSRSPAVTRDYAILGSMKLAYSSDKAIRELGYTVTPWPETVAKGIRSWREREARAS